MKIFISDLHLGDGSATDDFHRDKELLDFLDYAQDKGAELILVGDVYELWQGHLDKIMWAHEKVYRKLFKHYIERVYGNHDYLPFSKYWREIYRQDNILAMHGHQYDIFSRFKNPLFALKWPIGKYATLLIAEFERWFHPDADVWAEKMVEKYGKFLWDAAKVQNKAYKWPEQAGKLTSNMVEAIEDNYWNLFPKITVMGHTHQAILYRLPNGKIYANCGAWVDNVNPTYVCVTEDKVELRDGLNHKLIQELSIDE